MTIPASGAISFSALRTEFSGANPVSMSQYYKGGARVPNLPSINAAVPASGAIAVSNFRSTAAPVVLLVNQNISVGGYATAFYELELNGDLATNLSTTQWITPKIAMADFEVRATQTSSSGAGTFSGTLNTWMSLSTFRGWTANRASASGPGVTTRTLTVEVRRASDLVVLSTATITLTSTN